MLGVQRVPDDEVLYMPPAVFMGMSVHVYTLILSLCLRFWEAWPCRGKLCLVVALRLFPKLSSICWYHRQGVGQTWRWPAPVAWETCAMQSWAIYKYRVLVPLVGSVVIRRALIRGAVKHQKQQSLPLRALGSTSTCCNYCLRWWWSGWSWFRITELRLVRFLA